MPHLPRGQWRVRCRPGKTGAAPFRPAGISGNPSAARTDPEPPLPATTVRENTGKGKTGSRMARVLAILQAEPERL